MLRWTSRTTRTHTTQRPTSAKSKVLGGCCPHGDGRATTKRSTEESKSQQARQPATTHYGWQQRRRTRLSTGNMDTIAPLSLGESGIGRRSVLGRSAHHTNALEKAAASNASIRRCDYLRRMTAKAGVVSVTFYKHRRSGRSRRHEDVLRR